jgi:hypothetical protein
MYFACVVVGVPGYLLAIHTQSKSPDMDRLFLPAPFVKLVSEIHNLEPQVDPDLTARRKPGYVRRRSLLVSKTCIVERKYDIAHHADQVKDG